MSEAVERKLLHAARQPVVSPSATRSPGWTSCSQRHDAAAVAVSAPPTLEVGLQRLDEFARRGGGLVEVRRIAEHVQVDADLMAELKGAGIVPGGDVQVRSDLPLRRCGARGRRRRGGHGGTAHRARRARASTLIPLLPRVRWAEAA